MGFAWGSWLHWPAVFELEGQVCKLEGVIYYVHPKSVGSTGFLRGKERIRVPTKSKHSSLEALKRPIIEYTGLKSESEKRNNKILDRNKTLSVRKVCRMKQSFYGIQRRQRG